MPPKCFKLFLFGILYVFLNQAIFSQNTATHLIDENSLSGSQLVTTNTIELNVRKILPAAPLRGKTTSAQLFLQLDMGEDYVAASGSVDYTLTVNYEINLLDGSGGLVATLPAGSIVTSSAIPERLLVIDFLSELLTYSNFEKLEIKLTSAPALQTTGVVPGLNQFINNNQRLTARSVVTFGVDVRLQSSFLLSPQPVLTPKNINILTNRVQQFDWNLDNYDLPNYEIQILKLLNIDPTKQNNQHEITALVDWSKALKVETQSSTPSITLTIGEGTGFYIWRVRAIGNYFEGGIANHENYGQWSSAASDGQSILLNKNALNLSESFYFEDINEDINWIYNRVFTEGNQEANGIRVSEGMSYADGLLNLRQNQVFNSAQNTTLITQNVIDYSGRPALNTLPVPVNGNLSSGLKLGFIQNQNGDVYTARDFDFNDISTNNIYAPDIINDLGTPFEYYSDNNPNVQIPNAEGYAFKRTLFKNDGTNRVSEESGVGKVHALGTQSNGQGRTTRVLYAAPSDDELIRLFGEEAPLAEKVLKTITLDPNNVASITYTTIADGNVIATALATVQTSNLEPLSASANQFTVRNTATNNFFKDRQFISFKRLAFSTPTLITLEYDLPCATNSWTNCNGGNCEYEIQFILQNLTKGESFITNPEVVTCSSNIVDLSNIDWKDVATNTPVTFPSGPSFTLDPGEYIFTKVLSDKLPVNFATNTVSNNNLEEQIIIDAIGELMSGINNEDDFDQFEIIINNLASHFQDYNANPSNTVAINAIIGILDLPQNINLPVGFTLSYNGSGNSPGNLSFETECCGTANIQVDKPDKCIPCEDFIQPILDGSMDEATISNYVSQHFITYLDSKLASTGIALQDVAPGFTKGSLQFMITQMLISKYFIGNTRQHTDLNWYKAVHDDQGELVFAEEDGNGKLIIDLDGDPTNNNPSTNVNDNNGFNYKCKKIYNCWTQAVDMLDAFEFEDDKNVMNEFNDRQGNDASEDHFDDDEAKGKKKFGQGILNWLISEKMRKFNNNAEGKVPKERLEALSNLPNLFMDCAGYQFAAIIDGSIIPPPAEYKNTNWNGTTPTQSSLNTALGSLNLTTNDHGFGSYFYAPVLTEKNNPSSIINPSRLYYPYILRPEWMFKYFVYNVTFKNSSNNTYIKDIDPTKDIDLFINNHLDGYFLLPNHLDVEIQTCYNLPVCPVDGHNLCFNPCRYTHVNWSSGQRLNFYNMIKYAPIDPELKEMLDNSFDDDPYTCGTSADYIPEAIAEIDDIRLALESRRAEFEVRITNMFLQNCYEIVDCNPGTGQVSIQQIKLMAQAVINEANKILDNIADNVNQVENGYPKCTENTCHWIEADGSCSHKKELVIEYFQPCDQVLINQIEYWGFLPFIPTNCVTNPPSFPPISPGDQAQCDESKNYSNTYSVDNSSLNN